MSTAKIIKNKKEYRHLIEELSFKNLPKIKDIAFVRDEIVFVLNDERIIYIPITWSKKLNIATPKERMNFINSGTHIFWDDIDEIIGVKNILFGNKLFS